MSTETSGRWVYHSRGIDWVRAVPSFTVIRSFLIMSLTYAWSRRGVTREKSMAPGHTVPGARPGCRVSTGVRMVVLATVYAPGPSAGRMICMGTSFSMRDVQETREHGWPVDG